MKLKKAVSFVLGLVLSLIFAVFVSAESENLLSDFTHMDWQGDLLYLDNNSSALYFKKDENKEVLRSELLLEVNQAETSFLFYIDIGNGALKGDSGFCSICFYDEDNKELLSKTTGDINSSDNYARYYVGENKSFYPIPKGARTVKITLAVNKQKSGGNNANVYFRNLSLFFSKEMPFCDTDDSSLMKSSMSLSKVEVGVTPFVRWLWIGIVFLVAMAFFLIRVWRQKYTR